MPSVFVLYEKKAGARFDHHYCCTQHLELIREICIPFGLEDVTCHTAWEEHDPYEAILVLRYRSTEGFASVLADPESRRIFADVACFTDLLPRISRMT